MKKTIFSLAMIASIALIGCSNDDGAKIKCDSCVLGDGKAEICDNGDGTFTAKHGGETVELTQEDLDALELTAKEYILLVCAVGTGI
ncbi:hypothetical protein DKG77_03535 [Flagellimonas aquimarina]|uniref:Uncharacterized protein n=2 Tax=Flagellimonas aquimarina TaxID=2201895 RepID=A0A316L6K1_9FLAO|nr:hypothetical protein DKG77_03535 [Allomuricauda koreensis]